MNLNDGQGNSNYYLDNESRNVLRPNIKPDAHLKIPRSLNFSMTQIIVKKHSTRSAKICDFE
jgi:hypothetical protein